MKRYKPTNKDSKTSFMRKCVNCEENRVLEPRYEFRERTCLSWWLNRS